MAASISQKSGLFSAADTWDTPPTGTSGFTVLATHVVTLDASYTATAGTITLTEATTPGTTVPGTLIISGGVTLQINSGSILTMNGLLDIQNGTLVQRDGCIFSEGANGAIYLAAGCTWSDGNGGSCNLAGSVYINGGTVNFSVDGTMSLLSGAVLYLRGGAMIFSYEFVLYTGATLVYYGGTLNLGSVGIFRFRGTAKLYMKRRGVLGPIDIRQAYGFPRTLNMGV
jgi:hypothetical protein